MRVKEVECKLGPGVRARSVQTFLFAPLRLRETTSIEWKRQNFFNQRTWPDFGHHHQEAARNASRTRFPVVALAAAELSLLDERIAHCRHSTIIAPGFVNTADIFSSNFVAVRGKEKLSDLHWFTNQLCV